MRKLLFVTTLFSILIRLYAQTDQVLHEEQWGGRFNLHMTENGEILAVSSIVFHNDKLYLYDMAERRIVILDSAGSFIKETALSSIGRYTYVGDDFVVLNNNAIFLNTVDKKLEIFELNSGKHKLSVSYPHDYYASESKRSHRIINRIYLDGEDIVLATGYKLFYFDYKSEKVIQKKKSISAESGGRFLFYDGTTTVVLSHERIVINNNKSVPAVKSRYPISGKQFFLKNSRLFALSLDSFGFRIIEVND